jgi:hypothetical protein
VGYARVSPEAEPSGAEESRKNRDLFNTDSLVLIIFQAIQELKHNVEHQIFARSRQETLRQEDGRRASLLKTQQLRQDLDTDLFSSTPDTLFLNQPVYGKPVSLADTTTSPACLDVFRGSTDTLDCDPDLMLLNCIRSSSWEVPSMATSNEIPQFNTPAFDTPSDPQEASITLTNDFPSPMTTLPQETPRSSTSTSGKTILHILSEQGREDLVPLILQSGACINECDDRGMTALHHAAKNNYTGTVKALLEHQACGSIFNHDGLAAIHLAASNGCIETLQVMLSFGIDLNMKTQRAIDEC